MIDLLTSIYGDGSGSWTIDQVSKLDVRREDDYFAITFDIRFTMAEQADPGAVLHLRLDYQDLPDLIAALLGLANEDDLRRLDEMLEADKGIAQATKRRVFASFGASVDRTDLQAP